MAQEVYQIPPGQHCEKVIRNWKKARRKQGTWHKGRWESKTCQSPATHVANFRYFCDEHGPTPGKYDMDPYYRTKAWRELRAEVIARDRGICRYCGARAHQADHVIPRSKQGPDTLDNLVACCASCNDAARSARFPSFEAKRAYVLTARKIAEPKPYVPEQEQFPMKPKGRSLFRKKLAARIREME